MSTIMAPFENINHSHLKASALDLPSLALNKALFSATVSKVLASSVSNSSCNQFKKKNPLFPLAVHKMLSSPSLASDKLAVAYMHILTAAETYCTESIAIHINGEWKHDVCTLGCTWRMGCCIDLNFTSVMFLWPSRENTSLEGF